MLNADLRVARLNSPGSCGGITIGTGLTEAAPGSATGMHPMVLGILAAAEELTRRGVAYHGR